jgi:two-component system chemotaxis response regulator CheB
VAASTGGPRALETLLPALCPHVRQPIVIVQHMPAPFTQSLANSLNRRVCHEVREAGDGELVRERTVYLAPGGKHLLLRGEAGLLTSGLTELPPENGFRPSADVLYRSAAAVLGGDVVGVILTGMAGDRIADGTAGLGALKRAGGYVIAQDEASSVVWGMPGSVVAAGLADEVLPLEGIGAAVVQLASGGGL